MRIYLKVKFILVHTYILLIKLISIRNLKYFGTIRPDTWFFRKNYYLFIKSFLFKDDAREREKLKDNFSTSDFQIDKTKGYAFFYSRDIVLGEAIKYANKILHKNMGSEDELYKSININPSNQDHTPILQLICSELLIEPISNYLGEIPVLFQANIVTSFNRKIVKNSAQFIHVDRDDFRIVKCFIALHEIDEDSGPLHFFNKKTSKEIYKKLFKKGKINQTGNRITDSDIEEEDWKTVTKFIGKTGSMALIDTSNCFHFGSREATKERNILLLEFCSPYNQNLPLWGRQYLNFSDYNLDNIPLAQKVMGITHLYS